MAVSKVIVHTSDGVFEFTGGVRRPDQANDGTADQPRVGRRASRSREKSGHRRSKGRRQEKAPRQHEPEISISEEPRAVHLNWDVGWTEERRVIHVAAFADANWIVAPSRGETLVFFSPIFGSETAQECTPRESAEQGKSCARKTSESLVRDSAQDENAKAAAHENSKFWVANIGPTITLGRHTYRLREKRIRRELHVAVLVYIAGERRLVIRVWDGTNTKKNIRVLEYDETGLLASEDARNNVDLKDFEVRSQIPAHKKLKWVKVGSTWEMQTPDFTFVIQEGQSLSQLLIEGYPNATSSIGLGCGSSSDLKGSALARLYEWERKTVSQRRRERNRQARKSRANKRKTPTRPKTPTPESKTTREPDSRSETTRSKTTTRAKTTRSKTTTRAKTKTTKPDPETKTTRSKTTSKPKTTKPDPETTRSKTTSKPETTKPDPEPKTKPDPKPTTRKAEPKAKPKAKPKATKPEPQAEPDIFAEEDSLEGVDTSEVAAFAERALMNFEGLELSEVR